MTASPRDALAERLGRVRERIANAADASGRDPGGIALIVVTKYHPASLVRELAELGVRDVAENRHQEASAKAGELADLGLRWHFVGQLQRNKAAAVAHYARAIHSVDRTVLVRALGRTGRVLDVFLEVNLTDDPARGGCRPEELGAIADAVLEHPSMTLRGVMAIAPLGEDPRPAFARLRSCSESVQRIVPSATAISAGMSHDFEAAIAEGATHLRIGTAITGNRPVEG